MLTFENSRNRIIGRAECLDIVGMNEDGSMDTVGGADDAPHFLIRVTFKSTSPHCLDNVPTGNIARPYIQTTDEMLVTDGDSFTALRFATPEQLEENEMPVDERLCALDDDELPERLTVLTTADKDYMVGKIQEYCKGVESGKDIGF